jgi:hypothetical protein
MKDDETREKFLTMLDRVCDRPGMYVGKPSVRLIAIYMSGYEHALEDHEMGSITNGFGAWIFLKYDIYDSAWSWMRVLLHAFGDESLAVKKLPILVREFLMDHDPRNGLDWINIELTRRFPSNSKVPVFTFTTHDN